MSIELIKTLSHTLNDAELTDAISILVEARSERRANQLIEMKNTLVPGDTVEFYHSGQKKHIRGTIEKTKTKKAIVIEESAPHMNAGRMSWDVPMGMLKKVSA